MQLLSATLALLAAAAALPAADAFVASSSGFTGARLQQRAAVHTARRGAVFSPLIRVVTSAAVSDSTALLKAISSSMAAEIGKPEKYVMTVLEAQTPMTMSGSDAPAAYIEVKSIGTFSPDKTRAISSELCALLESELGVDKDRTYIEFANAVGNMWGWNGATF